MRRRIGIIALILAVALLAAVPAIRSAQVRAMFEANRRYEAALYYAHVRAVDSTTSEPIDFRLRWDTEEISPFSKGSGPTVVEEFPDGSKVLSAVGVTRQVALRVEVMAEGFQSVFLEVEPRGGGVLTQDANRLLQTAKLTPAPHGEAIPAKQ